MASSRIAEKFEYLLDTYRRPDGSRWGGKGLEDATGGVVTRSYVSTLRKGNIVNPGFDKLRAIAKAMGFPPELWFEDMRNLRAAPLIERTSGQRAFADRLNHLFEVVRDERTGHPYSNADVVHMSLGDLSEEEVDSLRNGRIESPTVDQVLALAEVFGVDPSYFLSRSEKPPLLDEEAMIALNDRKSSKILHKSVELSEGEKDLVLDLISHLGNLRRPSTTGGDEA